MAELSYEETSWSGGTGVTVFDGQLVLAAQAPSTVSVALVTEDVSHRAATYAKAVLEAAGHTVTLFTRVSVTASNLAGQDIIFTVRCQGDATTDGYLRDYIDAGIPVVIGSGQNSAGAAITTHPVVGCGLVEMIDLADARDGSLVQDVAHPALAGLSPGVIDVYSEPTWMDRVAAGASYVGTPLARYSASVDDITVLAAEAGTVDLFGNPFGARCCFAGFLYSLGAVEWVAAAQQLVLQLLDWCVSSYPASGQLQLAPLDLSGAGSYQSSSVDWAASVPTATTLTVSAVVVGESVVSGEVLGAGDGSQTLYQLSRYPVARLADLVVKLDGVAATAYSLSGDGITFDAPPAAGVAVTADYTGVEPAGVYAGLAASGEAIPGLVAEEDLTGRHLWLQLDLTTSDPLSTPAVSSLGVMVNTISLVALRSLFEQAWSLLDVKRNLVEQLWSVRLLAMLAQLYGNVPVRRAQLVQLWGAAQTLRARLEERYGDSERFRAALEQLYTFNDGLRALVDQPWSVASQPLRVLFDQLYAELDRDLLRAALEELYVLAAGEAVVQVVDIAVTVDGQKIASCHNINDEQDESLYYLTGELQLTDQAEFALCRRLASRVVIVVNGASSHYLVEEPRAAGTGSGTGYVVPLVSETILLGHAESELAIAPEQNWTGMRQALVQELAAPFIVDWRLPNTFLPANILYTNGRSKIELIREIVRSLGGIVQTSPAGELVCRPEYPQPVNSWKDAAADVELTDQDDFFQITGQPSSRPGYDRFFLTNDQVSGDDLRLEVEELSSREQQLQITPVPFSERVVLHHSGGDWVQVVADGVVDAAVAEQVEFVEGAGRTSRPVHGDVAIGWRQHELGAVTAAEDGGLAAEIAGNSLAWVEYRTRAVQFRVISDRVENVQVYPEVVA